MISVRPILDVISEVKEELASLDVYSDMVLSEEEERVWNKKFGKLVKIYKDLVRVSDEIVDYNTVR
jgi:hypothetical protein